MSSISTHVLDAATGLPAAGLAVTLYAPPNAEGWSAGTGSVTDADGRCTFGDPDAAPTLGTYRLVFATGDWFAAAGRETFYPEVVVTFAVTDPARTHHHVPLLLSPFAYSTYRGS